MTHPELHPEVLAHLTRHLLERHGEADFDPERALTYAGHERPGALAHYLRETPARAPGYLCLRCGERSFPVPPSYGHPARNAQLLRRHRELYRAVAGLDSDGQADYLEAFDRGLLAQVQLAEVRRWQRLRTKRADRPTVAARIARCQDYLIPAWVQLGSQRAAIAALGALARSDPARHQRITGQAHPLSPETLRKYLGSGRLDPRRRAWVEARLTERARA